MEKSRLKKGLLLPSTTWDTYAAAALNGLLSSGALKSMDAANELTKFAAELADGLMSERNKRYGE